MPPETKPVISKLSEMTCENCVYSVKGEELTINPGQPDEHMVNRSDCYLENWEMNVRTSRDFCSKGKWLTGRLYTADFASELSVEDYDGCYYQIVRAQMFPGAVSYADEYNARQQVLNILDEYIARDSTRIGFDGLPLGPNTELARIKELLVKLWGEW